MELCILRMTHWPAEISKRMTDTLRTTNLNRIYKEKINFCWTGVSDP